MKKALFGLFAGAMLIPAIGCGDGSAKKDKSPLEPSLSITMDKDEVTIVQGEKIEVSFKILRAEIKGSITVTVAKEEMPKGVIAPPSVVVPEAEEKGVLTLTATKTASGVGMVTITSEGGGKTATDTLKIIVKAADSGKKKPVDPKKNIDDKKKPVDPKKNIDDKKKPVDPKKNIDDKKKPVDPKKNIDDKKKPVDPKKNIDDDKKKTVDGKKTKTSSLLREDGIERVVIPAVSTNQSARLHRRPALL